MPDIEIDQSGRMEVFTVNTVLALSDGVQRAILIPALVKRDCAQTLRARGVRPKVVSVRMFAAGVFLLLEPHLTVLNEVAIDAEYPGYEGAIKGRLPGHIRRRVPRFLSDTIGFRSIGKKSGAHVLALQTYRGEHQPDKVITRGELLRFC